MKSCFLFAFLVPLLAGCAALDSCENTVSQTALSPDGARQIVVFTRGCGATAGNSTQVSLLPSSKSVGGEVGNVLVLGDEASVNVRWEDASTILVSQTGFSKMFKKESLVDGIRVEYN